MGISHGTSKNRNAITTAQISRREGFSPKRNAESVQTIITPPVTMGYCTDASMWESANTNKKFPTWLMEPPPTANKTERRLQAWRWRFVNSKSMLPDNSTVSIAQSKEYPAALVFSAVPASKVFAKTPLIPLNIKMPM